MSKVRVDVKVVLEMDPAEAHAVAEQLGRALSPSKTGDVYNALMDALESLVFLPTISGGDK